jgi:OOP family OmpA-OmpF porin
MRKLFFIFLCLATINNSYGQNLVPNPSFEEYTRCPKGTSDCGVVKKWYQPTQGSTDYYNECAITKDKRYFENSVSVPHNSLGYKYPHDGKGYIGMYLYGEGNNPEYREYFSTKLISPLVQNKKYAVRFYVSLARASGRGISNIQMLFSQDSIRQSNDTRLRLVPQLSYQKAPITDTANWTEVSWIYTAKGDEQFLTIGNFTKNSSCQVQKVTNNHVDSQDAYYYIDDVCVAEIKSDSSCYCNGGVNGDTVKEAVSKKDTIIQPKPLEIEDNRNVVLNNVFFETDKSDLLPASFNELNELVEYLQKNSSVKIAISGYTDNTGNEDKNLNLSDARAKAVASYLTSKGIDKNRVSYKGYGSSNPIASNDTQDGKAKNRRVEFKIIDK